MIAFEHWSIFIIFSLYFYKILIHFYSPKILNLKKKFGKDIVFSIGNINNKFILYKIIRYVINLIN